MPLYSAPDQAHMYYTWLMMQVLYDSLHSLKVDTEAREGGKNYEHESAEKAKMQFCNDVTDYSSWLLQHQINKLIVLKCLNISM